MGLCIAHAVLEGLDTLAFYELPHCFAEFRRDPKWWYPWILGHLNSVMGFGGSRAIRVMTGHGHLMVRHRPSDVPVVDIDMKQPLRWRCVPARAAPEILVVPKHKGFVLDQCYGVLLVILLVDKEFPGWLLAFKPGFECDRMSWRAAEYI